MLKTQKGITMVALVITIIVLLIIASVSIAALGEDDGIIKSTEEAKEQTDYRAAYEELSIKILELQKQKMGQADLNDLVEFLKEDKNYTYIIIFLNKLIYQIVERLIIQILIMLK